MNSDPGSAGRAGGRPPTLIQALLLASWLGGLVGLLDAGGVAFKRWGLGILTLSTPQGFWMAPLAYAVLFAVPLIVWWGLARAWRRAADPRIPTFLLSWIGGYSALQVLHVQLAPWAILALSFGLAARIAAGAAQPERFYRLARRGTGWLALGLIAGGLLFNAVRIGTERRVLARAALNPVPPGNPPNILLIILDTVRELSLSGYGNPRQTTPELDRFATEGVLFERAAAPSSWTNPSHATMFTGRHPHEHTSDWGAGLDSSHATLAEVLRDRGWLTGGFIANTRYLAREAGLARGFLRYEDHPLRSAGAMLGTTWLGRFLLSRNGSVGVFLGFHNILGRKNAPAIIEPFLRWIPAPGGRPFFAMLNFIDAHDPYLPPGPWRSKWDSTRAERTLLRRLRDRLPGGRTTSPTDQQLRFVQRELAAYEGAISYLDAQLGELFRRMDRRGQLDNTIVIVTSDHGEEFEEHGIMGHGKSLYWPVLGVPLILRWPGRVPAGARISEPVGLRSLPATVAELLELPEAGGFPGTPLSRFWSGSPAPPPPDPVLSELSRADDAPRRAPVFRGDMKSLLIGGWHYIRNGDGSEEIYELSRDPWERENLIGSADPSVLATARAIIAAIPPPVRRGTLRQTF